MSTQLTDDVGEPIIQKLNKALAEISNAREDVETGKHHSAILSFLRMAQEYVRAAVDDLQAVEASLASQPAEQPRGGQAHSVIPVDREPFEVLRDIIALPEAQRAEQIPVESHPDDAAVDAFADALKAKLAEARAKGRGGWNNDEPGMHQRLSNMLRDHVEKGDPRDVGNFAMFLHQRGESILPGIEAMAQPKPEQAVGDGVVAYVPVHPRTGPLWMDTYGADTKPDRARYPAMPLYGAPRPAVATPAGVEIGEECLRRVSRQMNRLGIATPVSIEEFGAKLESELFAMCRALDALWQSRSATPAEVTDEQIIAICNAAGIRWIPPGAYDDDDDFPGMFDMTRIAEMRSLFAALASPSAGAVVPEAITPTDVMDRRLGNTAWGRAGAITFAQGWNACREAMLAAAPEVQS